MVLARRPALLLALCLLAPRPAAAQPSPAEPAAPSAPAAPEAARDLRDAQRPYCLTTDSPATDPAAAQSRAEQLLTLGQLDDAARALCSVVLAGTAAPQLAAHERLRRLNIERGDRESLAAVLARLVTLHLEAGDRDGAAAKLDELVALAPEHAARGELERALGRGAAKRDGAGSVWDRARSALGILAMLGIAWALSYHRSKVSLRIVGWGMALQLGFAVLVLWTPPGRYFFSAMTDVVNRVISFSDAGASFLFGKLYDGLGPTALGGPVQYVDGLSGDYRALGLVFAFHVLPTIIFIGALMSVLYHLNVIQRVVHVMAWVMQRSMRTSGAETFAAAANVFVGQTEAPLIIKPYLARMTSSELMAVMVPGFASVAGGVLAAYVRFGIDAGHLVAASVMSAPAALVISKIMHPEVEESETRGGHVHDPPKVSTNLIDAATAGASDGMKLALNVAAMLVAFIALIAMVNALLGWAGGLVGMPSLSLGQLFGYLFYPLSWVMGVDTADLLSFGRLMGLKISLNEFVAYVELGNLRDTLSPRTFVIATYALCGFANFASIGIQIGGIGEMAPERRGDLAKLGLRAMIGGALTTSLMACVAGLLL